MKTTNNARLSAEQAKMLEKEKCLINPTANFSRKGCDTEMERHGVNINYDGAEV
ncbi:hypothetical protein U1Q18_052213 [Sarracenia purpurea var. burkii]